VPGKPKTAKLWRDIQRKGGEEYIWSLVRSGLKVREIGERFGVSNHMIYNWINKGGEERRTAYRLARKESADAVADRAGDILDDLADESTKREITSPEVKLAEARAQHDKWLASKADPEMYGETKAPLLQIGELHLSALRQHGAVPALPSEPVELPALPKGD
jgi:hypothetical protein